MTELPNPTTHESWMDDAACLYTDPEIFFTDLHTNNALKICATCDTKIACLNYATRNNITEGIFGGVTAEQREEQKGVRYG